MRGGGENFLNVKNYSYVVQVYMCMYIYMYIITCMHEMYSVYMYKQCFPQ